MMRRDYFLRMVEEFSKKLAAIIALKQARRFPEARQSVENELLDLAGADSRQLARLSETELLAILVRAETAHPMGDRVRMLASLLKEAGELAVLEGRDTEGRGCLLKGLHLLLNDFARREMGDAPELTPAIDAFVSELGDQPLPVRTQALLMEHYERSGCYGAAEDLLFCIAEADPTNPALVEFGIRFYERLLALDTATLEAGNLPREEVESGLQEWRSSAGQPR